MMKKYIAGVVFGAALPVLGCGSSGSSDPEDGVGAVGGTGGEVAAAEEPGAEQPGWEQPGAEQPGVEQPGAEQPGVEQPGAEQPGVEQPGAEQPGVEQPGVDEPGVDEPGVDEPGVDEPGVDEPGVDEPGVDEPAVDPNHTFESNVIDSRVLDDGGSGPYKAIAATESTLTEFVVYRPEDLRAAAVAEEKLPVLVFANGGCNNTSVPHERMLSDIASHGYLVVALGPLQRTLNDRPLVKADNAMMIEAIDWVADENADATGEYYGAVDMEGIAMGGQSCGGAQVMATGDDPRVKTYMIFNSGIGTMEMSGATPESRSNFHGPVIYIVGGPGDVATENAEVDYSALEHVPVAFANALDTGHGGTYHLLYGGSYGVMALKWLDWQLKGVEENSAVFLEPELSEFPGWTMKSRNF